MFLSFVCVCGHLIFLLLDLSLRPKCEHALLESTTGIFADKQHFQISEQLSSENIREYRKMQVTASGLIQHCNGFNGFI